MILTKSVTTPATNSLFQHREKPKLKEEEQSKLRSGIAKLLYLSINTRPDIAMPVNYLCTRVNNFDDDDKVKFIRILEYLYGTISDGLVLKIDESNPNLYVFADASYGISTIDRKSQSGMIIKLGNAMIIAKSKKQKIVTRSSTESELVACSDSVSYIIYITKLLKELNYPINKIIIYQDNISTINLISNQRPTSQRTMHIDIRYFFIRERKEMHNYEVKYISTDKMTADVLTKPLQGEKFIQLKNDMMGIRIVE